MGTLNWRQYKNNCLLRKKNTKGIKINPNVEKSDVMDGED